MVWLPECNSMRTRPGRVEPEVYFGIVHVAGDGRHGSPVAPYREQTVEIALGPKDAFKNDNIGTLTRRISTDGVVTALPPLRGNHKPPREPKTPRVVELLRKDIEWRRQLDAGEVRNQADIARREGISRARVTQVMGMLRLAPSRSSPIPAIRFGSFTRSWSGRTLHSRRPPGNAEAITAYPALPVFFAPMRRE